MEGVSKNESLKRLAIAAVFYQMRLLTNELHIELLFCDRYDFRDT